MPATSITPYLFFSGRCEEALEFYRKTLGAEVDMMMRFDETPDPVPEGMLPPGFEKKVMHASFRIRGIPLMASDGCSPDETFSSFRLALQVPTEAETRRVFDALSDGGSVIMPLDKTFWSSLYGQLTDRFAVGWMVMVAEDMPSQ
jgi:PhnB protein